MSDAKRDAMRDAMRDAGRGAEELAQLRGLIEDVDRQIVVLIAQRIAYARRVGAAKRRAGLATLDPAREAAVVRHASAVARDFGLDEDVRYVFWQLMAMSRRAQLEERQRPTSDRASAAPRVTAIIGLGLIGGSLARDLKQAGDRILAHDAVGSGPERAKDEGVVDEVIDASLMGLHEADRVVIATPVDAAEALLGRIAPHLRADAVVTDTGSTKAGIAARATALGLGARFVGSHPFAGDHRAGWGASRDGMFRDSTVFLCPSLEAAPEAIAQVQALWEAVGGKCRVLDAIAHDERMAWVSHLPQVASSAVAAALATSERTPADLGRGGRDVTRLAASAPEMWSAISRSNHAAIAPAVAALIERLEAFEVALEADDEGALQTFFRAGREWVG